MKLHKETIQIQHLLGQYVRDGIERKIPGVHPDRIKHYRRLVNNVVTDTMNTAFPISRAAVGPDVWTSLVDEFFTREDPGVPQLWKLPFEFYRFHLTRNTGKAIKHPYLSDLLYFEWMEIEVHVMPDREIPDFRNEGDLLKDILVVNPEYEIIQLQYPVHRYSAKLSPEHKGNYYILIYRMPDSGNVHFMDLSELHLYLLDHIVEREIPLDAIKREIALAAGIESETYLDEALNQLMAEWLQKRLILGFRNDTETSTNLKS